MSSPGSLKSLARGTGDPGERCLAGMPHSPDNSQTTHFADILGRAVVEQWHALGQDVQRLIFEAAVEKCERAGAGDIREALAVFLHERHPRTEHDEDGKSVA